MAVEFSALASFMERLNAMRRQQQEATPPPPQATDMPEWSRQLDPNDFQGRTREEILKAQAQAQAAKGDLQMMPEPSPAQPPMPMPKPAMPVEPPAEPVQPPMPQQAPPARPAPQAGPASLAAQPTNLYDDNVQLAEPMNLRKEFGPEVGGVGGSYIDMVRRARQTGEMPGGGAPLARQQPPAQNQMQAEPAAHRGGGGGLPWRAILGGAGAIMQELDGQRGAVGNFMQARNARIGANREANQTRQAAIDLGMDPELAANMPIQALTPLLGHLYEQKNSRAEPIKLGANDVLLDPNSYQPLYQGQPKPTSAIQEYEYAKTQGYPGSFAEFEREMKKAGATNFTVDQRQQTESEKAIGKWSGEKFGEIQDEATKAMSALNSLDRMEQAMKSPGFYSGFGGDTVKMAKQMGQALGFNPEGIASMEDFEAQSNRTVFDSIGSLGVAISNSDRIFVQNIVPNLGTTPEGNLKRIDVQRKVEQRRIEAAKIARDYYEKNGTFDQGYFDALQEWSEANPLFPKAAQAGQPAEPDQPGQAIAPGSIAVHPQTGQRIRLNENGEWEALQ